MKLHAVREALRRFFGLRNILVLSTTLFAVIYVALLVTAQLFPVTAIPYAAATAGCSLFALGPRRGIWHWFGSAGYLSTGIVVVLFSGGSFEAHLLLLAFFAAQTLFLRARLTLTALILLLLFYAFALLPVPFPVVPANSGLTYVAGLMLSTAFLGGVQLALLRMWDRHEASLAALLGILERIRELDFRVDQPRDIGVESRDVEQLAREIKNFYLDLQTSLAHGNEMNHQLSGFVSSFDKTAEVQSESIQGASATIKQFQESIEAIETNIAGAAGSAAEIDLRLNEISDAVNELETSMAQLVDMTGYASAQAENVLPTLRQATEAMEQVRTISGEIGNIIQLITDVSDETNLLALNASIEAARAGEYGRGFAVVAEHVSRLAERTATSVQDIERLVQDSRSSAQTSAELVTRLVESTNSNLENNRRIRESSREVQSMLNTQALRIHEIADGMSALTLRTGAIESAAQEQKRSAGDISDRMLTVSMEIQEVLGRTRNLHTISNELDNFLKFANETLQRLKVS